MQSTQVEIWRRVPGYEGLYEVSDAGTVRRANGATKAPRRTNGGHLYVELWKNNQRQREYVHRLVLFAFTGPARGVQEVRHLNGNPSDNRLGNLQWGSRSENVVDEVVAGHHWQSRKTHCKHGHAYSPENTLWRGKARKQRVCRTCNETYQREYQARRKRALLGAERPGTDL